MINESNCKITDWSCGLQIASVIDTVKDFSDLANDEELYKTIGRDCYMHYAIIECYDLLRTILKDIVKGDRECRQV